MSTPTITILKFNNDALWQVKDSDCNLTVEKDIASGPCTLLSVHITPATTSENTYVFFYDDINPTLATTEPDEVIWVPGASPVTIPLIPINPPNGLYFENGLSFAGATVDDQTGAPSGTNVVVLTLIPGAV